MGPQSSVCASLIQNTPPPLCYKRGLPRILFLSTSACSPTVPSSGVPHFAPQTLLPPTIILSLVFKGPDRKPVFQCLCLWRATAVGAGDPARN